MMRKHLFTRGNVTGGKVRDATSTEGGVWLCGWRPLACVEDSQQGVLSRRGEERLRGGVKEDRPPPLGQDLREGGGIGVGQTTQ